MGDLRKQHVWLEHVFPDHIEEGFFPVAQPLPITPYTNGLHYASGIFEGIRAVWDERRKQLYVIVLDQHVKRFFDGMKKLLFTAPTDDAAGSIQIDNECVFYEKDPAHVREKILETITKNMHAGAIIPKEGCYIRPLMFRADSYQKECDENGREVWQPTYELGVYSLQRNILFLILAKEWGKYFSGPPMVNIVEAPVQNEFRKIKMCANYGPGAREKNLAKVHGDGEALFIDTNGYVLEGSGENIFGINTKNTLITPSTEQCILPGTKRGLVIQIANNLGVEVEERKIPLEELLHCPAAFFTGTATGVECIQGIRNKEGIHEFDLENKLFFMIKQEYDNLISGGPVHPQNQELQEAIRTPVPIER